jgi:hypothetical protein
MSERCFHQSKKESMGLCPVSAWRFLMVLGVRALFVAAVGDVVEFELDVASVFAVDLVADVNAEGVDVVEA